MKPFFRLPTSSAALAALLILGTGALRADDDQSRHAAAESLLATMHTDKMVAANTARLASVVDRFSQSAAQGATLTAEQTETMKKAEDEARATINKELGYDVLKEEFVKGYAESFSEAELKELTVFYNTPAGQKLLEKQPTITDKVGQAAQQKMRTVMPGVVAKLREVAQKVLPPPPAPATVVPPPFPPGAGPVGPVPPVPPAPPGLPPNPAAPPLPKLPVPPAPPAAPSAITPPVTTNPVPAFPTPLPAATPSSTPSAQ